MSEQKSRLQIICDKINSSDHEGDVLAPLWVLEVALVLVVSQTRWLHGNGRQRNYRASRISSNERLD